MPTTRSIETNQPGMETATQAAKKVPSPAEKLRAPFEASQIRKLPRVTCRDCSQNKQAKVCDRHEKIKCTVCSNWITSAHIHLDYVGHAAVTDRLLQVDPGWSWEPAYRVVDPQLLAAAIATGNTAIVEQVLDSSPHRLDESGGLWIKLTVGGITRLGYGTTERSDGDATKILIGDAIRNAAMRFGVGLDLWSKEELTVAHNTLPANGQPAQTPVEEPERSGRDWIAEAGCITDLEALLQLGHECNEAGEFVGTVQSAFLRRRGELQPQRSQAA